MRNKKGFTLIELLAVIVILGLLIAIAIPSITKYITQSRKKTLATTISKYVDSGMVGVNNGEYIFNDSNVIYAIPIECIPMERGGDNPFGEWLQANNEYWAYILVQYNPSDFSYNYGFTFKHSAGYGMYPVSLEDMDVKGKDILTNLELAQPRTGLASNFSTLDYWEKSGFNVNNETRVKVLRSESEGETGDGENTCTLHRKGLNYEEIEEIKNRPGTLINSGNNTSLVFGKEIDRNLVEEIYTLDYVDISNDAIDSWDASIQKNGSIMAWITDKDNDEVYELYLAQEGGIIAPQNMAYMFGYFKNAEIIDLDQLDTSNTISMSCLFYRCEKLTKLNISNLKTENVEKMYAMFANCGSLKSLNLNHLNTEKVVNMSSIFLSMKSLTDLKIDKISTMSVTDMGEMFFGLSALKKVDLSNFNTENVTNMQSMFYGCNSLETLDLSNFNTESVINMNLMFYGCIGLETLDLSNFKTTSVTDMHYMFREASALKSVNISSFNTSNVTNMKRMFYGCSSLEALDLSNFNTSNVTDMHNMFDGCRSLKKLDLSNFNTSKVTDMSGMFADCRNLTDLNISSFDTSSVNDMSHMFRNTYGLTTMDLSSFNTENVTNMNGMFGGCINLTTLDLSNFDTSNVDDIYYMFGGAVNLKKIDIRQFDFSNATSYELMLNGVPSTSQIIVKDDVARNWILTNVSSNYTNIITVNEL